MSFKLSTYHSKGLGKHNGLNVGRVMQGTFTRMVFTKKPHKPPVHKIPKKGT